MGPRSLQGPSATNMEESIGQSHHAGAKDAVKCL